MADDAPGADDLDLTTDPQFLKFIEAHGGLGLDPLSDEGLRLQAAYVKLVGDHPLDTLKSLSSNVLVKPSDRIAAAKALLEYGARKVPSQFEVTGANGSAFKLDASVLAKLDDEELSALERILSKVSQHA